MSKKKPTRKPVRKTGDIPGGEHAPASTSNLIPEKEVAVAAERQEPTPPKQELTMPEKTDDDKKKPAKKTAPKTVPAPEREITLNEFARTLGDLGRAFAVSESLANGGKVIKRTRTAWKASYEKWLKAPRG